MRLLACVSHHGYGHLAQSAPVLNHLASLRPDLELVVRSALPRERLAMRINAQFAYQPEAVDCGFAMEDAIRIDKAASLAAYRAFHREWIPRLEREAERLRTEGITAVFSNVAYQPLAAAKRSGLPSVALCSLNWADIFSHYFADEIARNDESRAWVAQMRAAYGGASAFLRPEPAMTMTDLSNRRAIPPIATQGRNQSAILRPRLGISEHQKLVLIGMGGIAYRPPLEQWPASKELVWLVPDEWAVLRQNAIPFSATGLGFLDLLASSDALITKPGYGSFVEAAVHGLPVLYLPRPDWPESPVLESWLHTRTRAERIDEITLHKGDLAHALFSLWANETPSPPRADGAAVAAEYLSALLDD